MAVYSESNPSGMTELIALDLVRKRLVTKHRESLVCVYRAEKLSESTFNVKKTGERYRGTVTYDHYKQTTPKARQGNRQDKPVDKQYQAYRGRCNGHIRQQG